MVLTPGATIAAVSSKTWRTIRPLARIFSNSAADLHTIMLDLAEKSGCHLIDGEVAVNFAQVSSAAVIIHQRQGLPVIRLQSLRNHRFGIVRARNQLGAVNIAAAGNARRLEVNVVNSPAGGTRTPSGKTAQQLIIINLQIDDNQGRHLGNAAGALGEHAIQPFCLGARARKSVENEAAITVFILESDADHIADKIIGNKLAAVHDGGGFFPQFGAAGAILAQQVPGGNLWNAVAHDQALGLRAFAGARRAEQHNGTN